MKRSFFAAALLSLAIASLSGCTALLEGSEAIASGKELMEAGKYEEAVKLFDDASKLENAGSRLLFEAYYNKGLALSAMNKLSDSLEWYDRALDITPDSEEALLGKGNSLIKLKRFEEAQAIAEIAIHKNPSNDNALRQKARCLAQLGRSEEALVYCDQALSINPKNDDAYCIKGSILNELGRYDEAKKSLDKAILLNSENSEAYNNRGYTYYSLGKYDESIKNYDRSLELSPDSAETNCNKAISLYCLGEYEESLKYCDKALEANLEYSKAYSWKAKNLIEQGDCQSALDFSKKAVSLDPGDSFAYCVESIAYLRTEEYRQALAAADKAIALSPDDAEAYEGKASIYYYSKDYDKCVDFALSQALKRFPENEEILWFVADCYNAQYEYEKAIRQYQAVLGVNPENVDVLASIGWDYYYLQNYSESAVYKDKALKLDEKNSSALELGSSLEKLKLPESTRISDFVKDNYLYSDKKDNFDKLCEGFSGKGSVTAEDISRFVESIRYSGDLFTFTVYGEFYDMMVEAQEENHLTYRQIGGNTHYVRFSMFTANIAQEFKNVLETIKDPGDSTLIIDLRDNSGGLMEPSNQILDDLLPECTASYIIYRNGDINTYYSDKNLVTFKKVIIMVNENTASSSELLALGLKRHLNNVIIVGKPTVGKGVGQITYEDKDGRYMIFLVSFYWNVKEQNINGARIQPDIKINGNSDSDYFKAAGQATVYSEPPKFNNLWRVIK